MIAKRVTGFEQSVFSTFSQYAAKYNAINLSQGFPDFDCDSSLKNSAKKHIDEGKNQYAPSTGIEVLKKELVNLIKERYQRSCQLNQVIITTGATEGIFCALMGCVNPGDAVITFAPFYDSYQSSVEMCGGKLLTLELKGPDFKIDRSLFENPELKKAKVLIFNNPHNPTGRVFSREEIQLVVDFAKKNNIIILSDEVYEFLTYDKKFHSLHSFDEIKDQSLVISSGGKTFGVTGWKVGWVVGKASLVKACAMVHQYVTFSSGTPFQFAMSEALREIKEYLPGFKKSYKEKRDILYEGLVSKNFRPNPCEGTYFITCPISHMTNKSDVEFCKELIKEDLVAAIPYSPFYLETPKEQYIRFCFAKEEQTLHLAVSQLKKR